MTEETTVEATVEQTQDSTQKTPQELNKERQGERKTEKKKINRFNASECHAEIIRLENAGHSDSTYYRAVKNRQEAIKMGLGGRCAGK